MTTPSRRLWQLMIVGLFCSYLVGCANLEAKKVPVDLRARGCDHGPHMDGFRYYLSRPHVVVAERVEVGSSYRLTRLVGFRHPVRRDAAGEPLTVYALEPLLEPSDVLYHLQTGEPVDRPPVVHPVPLARAPGPAGITPVSQPIGTILGSDNTPVGDLLALRLLSDKDGLAEPVEPEAFQIVHLPDFEEQMRIQHRNGLAYSEYDLHFADGWQLTEVGGTFNSTEVAVRLLQSIGHAISTAAEVQVSAIESLPSPTSPRDLANVMEHARRQNDTLVLMKQSTFIPPGIYRVQKSWETQAAGGGFGMLRQLGIPVVEETTLHFIQ